MQITTVLRARIAPKAPFPASGNTFDSLFKLPKKPKKAWDGQDKDSFFRDKFAHVHAKQLKRRQAEQNQKKERLSAQGQNSKDTIASETMATPRQDFYSKFMEKRQKDPKLEYIYGSNAIRAVLQTRPATRLFAGAVKYRDIDPEIARLCEDRGVSVKVGVPLQHLEIMSSHGVHNKLVLETLKKDIPMIDAVTFDVESRKLTTAQGTFPIKRERPLGLFLDQVTDTHNMGALLRSALWFGVDFVAVSSRNSAPMSPSVVKASSGASEFLNVWHIDKPLRFFETLKDNDWSIVATSPDSQASQRGGLENIEPDDLPLNKPMLLVIGNEGEGVRTSLIQRSTHATRLESDQEDIDSLNVSVAAAVILSKISAK